MPEWLQLAVTVIGIISAVCGGVVIIYKITYKVNKAVDRPYPCSEVVDLQERMEKHGGYLSSDRKRIEDLEKDMRELKVRSETTASDVKDIKQTTDKILLMMIRGTASDP